MYLEHLFAFGTLRRGEENAFARRLHGHSAYLGPGRFQGRLYDFGDSPGAVPSDDPADQVVGDVFALDPAHEQELLAELDAYEGTEYERREVTVARDSGEPLRCWAYVYVGGLDGCAQIPSGDWREHRRPSA